MTKVELENITHVYEGGTCAIRDLNLVIQDSDAVSLLGPSGCGKTTLMKIISGILEPTEGRVHFDGEDVTGISPQERNVCLVFQFPVVYSGMDVYDNLAFPLKNTGFSKKDIDQKVQETAEMIGLKNKLDLDSNTLGPGDQQLVSVGRAIIREEPNVIMLDEPLTDIEPDRRVETRRLLKQIQKRLDITMIYVTHDQTEALTFAKSVAVMQNGKILQFAPKDELYNRPSHPFVGNFIGSLGMNLIDCTLADNKLDFGEFKLDISNKEKSTIKKHDTKFQMGIRPREIKISNKKRKGWILFKCHTSNFRGNTSVLILKKGEMELKALQTTGDFEVSNGDKLWLSFPKDARRIYSSENELLL